MQVSNHRYCRCTLEAMGMDQKSVLELNIITNLPQEESKKVLINSKKLHQCKIPAHTVALLALLMQAKESLHVINRFVRQTLAFLFGFLQIFYCCPKNCNDLTHCSDQHTHYLYC